MLGLPAAASAQAEFTQRGFIELRGFGYPQATLDDAGPAVGELRFVYEGVARFNQFWSAAYGIEGDSDTHRQDRRDAGLFWFDRSLRRPLISVRRLSIRYAGERWNLEAGKQVIRWGHTDLWCPTDRFAPRDYLYPLETEYLAVTAARVAYRAGDKTVEAVYVPRFTPTRLPIPYTRWLQALPADYTGYSFRDVGNAYPGGGQFGVRFRQNTARTDYSLMYFEGFDHTPSLALFYNPYTDLIKLRRIYPRTHMAGGGVSSVVRGVVLRGEAAWFGSPTPYTDNYIQYAVEGERTQGRITAILGYAGEALTADRAKNRLAMDRALTDVFVGRVLCRVNDRNEVSGEYLIRRLGDGYGWKAAYTRHLGNNWSVTAGGVWIGGGVENIFGNYVHNSHVLLTLRYSF